jgi:heterodisulfide reductase subunit C
MTIQKVWNLFDRSQLYECYECSKCSGSCPVALAGDFLGPRKILLRCLQLGTGEVIKDKLIWYCTTCQVCQDRCPQEIDIPELLAGLRNKAARIGNIPERVKFTVEKIAKTGRSVLGFKVDRERDRFDLPPIPEVDKEEISRILGATGFFGDLKIER